MPVISITLSQGQTNRDQKKKMVEIFTKTAVEITDLPEQAFTVFFYELEKESIGVGGKLLPEMLAAMNNNQ